MSGSKYRRCPACGRRGVRWSGATLRVCRFCGWLKSGVENDDPEPQDSDTPPVGSWGSAYEKG